MGGMNVFLFLFVRFVRFFLMISLSLWKLQDVLWIRDLFILYRCDFSCSYCLSAIRDKELKKISFRHGFKSRNTKYLQSLSFFFPCVTFKNLQLFSFRIIEKNEGISSVLFTNAFTRINYCVFPFFSNRSYVYFSTKYFYIFLRLCKSLFFFFSSTFQFYQNILSNIFVKQIIQNWWKTKQNEKLWTEGGLFTWICWTFGYCMSWNSSLLGHNETGIKFAYWERETIGILLPKENDVQIRLNRMK